MTAPLKCAYKPCSKYGRREHMLLTQRGNFCNEDCGTKQSLLLLQKQREKAKQAKDKAFKAETRAMRAKRNESDKKWQIRETQRAFNELVRLLDHGRPCIVHGMHLCGHESGWSAGHFLTVASQPALRFDMRNCFKQCLRSNKGDAKYVANNATIRTQFEYGIATMHSPELLMWLKGPHAAVNLSCQELADLRAVFKAESRRLRRGEGPSRDWRAIDPASPAATQTQ